MKLNIPVGVSDIEELRKRDYYYVDKTGLIFDLLKNSAAKVTLLTRPRRFGKTLAMSMLESFLEPLADCVINTVYPERSIAVQISIWRDQQYYPDELYHVSLDFLEF